MPDCTRCTACSLCTTCLQHNVLDVVRECYTNAWKKDLLASGVGCSEQMTRACAKHPDLFVDNKGRVVHECYRACNQVAASVHPTNVSGWSVQSLNYLEVNSAKHNVHYNKRRQIATRCTPLCMFDAESMRDKLVKNGVESVAISEVVCEYRTAYIDLYALIGQGGIYLHNGRVWHHPCD